MKFSQRSNTKIDPASLGRTPHVKPPAADTVRLHESGTVVAPEESVQRVGGGGPKGAAHNAACHYTLGLAVREKREAEEGCIEFPGAMGLRFAKYLDAAVADLKKHGIDRLIVDVRGNIGGGLGLARIVSYLCPGTLPIGHSLTPARLRTGYRKDDLPRVPMPCNKTELAWTLGRFLFRDKSVVLLTQGLGPSRFMAESSCSSTSGQTAPPKC